MDSNSPQQGEFIPGSSTRQRWSANRSFNLPFLSRTLSFGSMLAIAISYVQNESIGWAILHGLMSWFFVVYAALFY